MTNSDEIYLHSIELENYRQYYGKSIIEFSRDPKKNFTVLQGTNGAGKTNLLNAVYWCLYLKNIKGGKNKKMPIVNTRAIAEATQGKPVTMSVQIVFGTEDKKTVVVRRELIVYKKGEGKEVRNTKYGPMSEELDVPRTFGHFNRWSESDKKWLTFEINDQVPVDPFTVEVQGFLPESLADFVFFDGEKLENFFELDEAKQTKVKAGIETISQLELVSIARKHIEDAAGRYRDAGTDKGATEANKLNEWIKANKTKIEEKEAKLIENEEKAKPLRERLAEIDRILETSNDAMIKSKKELENTLLRSRKTLQQKVEDLESEKTSIVVGELPTVLLDGCMTSVLELIDRDIKSGKLPPPISEKLCLQILSENRCVCDTDISKNKKARNKILELRQRAIIEKLQPAANKLTDNIPSLKRFDERFVKVDKLYESITDTNKELAGVEYQLGEIDAFLKNVNDKEIRELREDRSLRRGWLKELDENSAVLKSEVETLNSRNSVMGAALDREIAKDEKKKIIQRKIQRAKDAIAGIDQLRKSLIDDFRVLLEEETRKIFFSIIWKRDTFEDVGIDENFKLSIKHKRGYESLGDLSAGESLFLAISFVTALKRIAGIKLPLVLDSPLGKIDGEPRLLSASHLPRFSQALGTQMSLLLTGTEYTSPIITIKNKNLGSFRDGLKDYVGREYHLIYDEKQEKTEVVHYGSV